MKVWKTASFQESAAKAIRDAHGLPHPVAAVLAARPWASAEETAQFLSPSLSSLGDPFLLPAMEPAVDRIWKALREKQPVVVYGDYDVDGVTSTAMICRVLARLGAEVHPVLPHRVDDGYGMSMEPVTRCMDEYKPGLIVTVDCGTGSREAVEYAAAQGVDVVVTDHHEASGEVAPALALVNPKLGDDPRSKLLAGVGVAYKLCHALVKKGREAGESSALDIDLREYLDLVALGTVCDIVPLLYDNRVLVRAGLERLARTGNAGLKALLEVAGTKPPYTAYALGFQLGPRLNAAGRLGTAMHALNLLMTGDAAEAARLAGDLDRTNRERRDIETEIFSLASAQLDESFDGKKDYALVAAGEGWNQGVVGIVASRLVRKYNRPAVVIAVGEDGVGKGSCRSIPGFNMVENLQACAALLTRWGGHAMAAGLELPASRIGEFREQFNRIASVALRHADLRPSITIDAWLEPGEFGAALYEGQKKLEPFGMDNPAPLWGLRGLAPAGTPRTVGSGHLKFSLDVNGAAVPAIFFGWGDRPLPDGPLDVAFQMKLNSFRGTDNLEMDVKAVRPSKQGE
ncbi:MAG: single-stranded-DNA-specific exonuclease RecJ [Kiritimatiellae bacterium]|nr:single-stranded-DNA-specific exonuclease RecJ [Kiritimatiellia bacterium]